MACIDRGEMVGSLFLDFRKAFDLVDHKLLIKKLSAYKFSGLSLQWFTSYLETRQQAINNGQFLSPFSTIKSGVPQGSILGPTLFLLFVNDLPLLLKHCFSDLFADDTTLHKSSPNVEISNAEILADFLITVYWSKRNKLPINFLKTTYMLLGAKHRANGTCQLDLIVDGTPIEKVSKHKLLGIVIDEHLSWTAHIDYMCSMLSQKISLLRQISSYVTRDIQKLLYQTCIVPLLDYGCNTWGTTSSTNIERLSKLQKRAALIILRADFMTPSALMFEQLGWLSVPKRLMYNINIQSPK